MKIHLSDISSALSPDEIKIVDDRASVERIKNKVLNEIQPQTHKQSGRKIARTALIAAVIALALSTAAFAAVTYSMNRKEIKKGESYESNTEYYDEDGNLMYRFRYEETGKAQVFKFTCPTEPEKQYNAPEFRAQWLPSEPTYGQGGTIDYKNTWRNYICDNGDYDSEMPYLICAYSVKPDCRYIIAGDTEILSEENQGDFKITKLTVDYTGTALGWKTPVSYILIFDQERGYLVEIAGTSDMETLEKIAENLEIRESDHPQIEYDENSESDTFSLDLSRG